MNIGIVHPYPVHAGGLGGVTRLHSLARFLARRHRVSIFTHEADPPGSWTDDLREAGVGHWTFQRPPAAAGRKTRWWLDRSAPYYVHRNWNPRLAERIAEADRRDPFDVVHLELGYMAPALSGVGRQAIRVLAEQEVMPLMLERLRAISWARRTVYENLVTFTAERARAFDRRTLPTFDLIYGITPRECRYLSAASGQPAAVLPHVVDTARFVGSSREEQLDDRLLFVGNFGHRPNVHAVEWFVAEVWPRVRALRPNATLGLVGAGLLQSQRSRLSVEGVECLGYQPDLPACYRRTTVVVNPIITGGGMRGKVLEALASGAALVSTSIGLEGVAAEPGRHCMVADTPEEFAAATFRYLEDRDLRIEHGRAGRLLVASLYDMNIVFARLEHDYEWMRSNRTARSTSA